MRMDSMVPGTFARNTTQRIALGTSRSGTSLAETWVMIVNNKILTANVFIFNVSATAVLYTDWIASAWGGRATVNVKYIVLYVDSDVTGVRGIRIRHVSGTFGQGNFQITVFVLHIFMYIKFCSVSKGNCLSSYPEGGVSPGPRFPADHCTVSFFSQQKINCGWIVLPIEMLESTAKKDLLEASEGKNVHT